MKIFRCSTVVFRFVSCAICLQFVIVVVRLGTQEAEGLSKSDVAKRMKVTVSQPFRISSNFLGCQVILVIFDRNITE